MDLRSALSSGSRLILDGAMGTMLEASGVCVKADTNLTDVAAVEQVHCGYLRAGAQAILANTLTANRLRLGLSGHEEQIAEINSAGVRITRRAAGTDAFVLGNIGPTGQILHELGGDLTQERCEEAYAEQSRLLCKEDIDGIIIETMDCLRQTMVAVRACKAAAEAANKDIPIIASMAFMYPVSGGSTSMGNTASSCARALTQAGADAIGMNCGALTPDQMVEAVAALRRGTSLPIAVEMNAGLPTMTKEGAQYSMSPEQFALHMRAFEEKGAQILGGCCGTTPAHIKALTDHRSSA